MQRPSALTGGLRVAVEMERRGIELYARAQAFVEDRALRALLRELCEDEKTHYATFASMLERLGAPSLSPEENELEAARAAALFFPGGLMQVAMEGALASTEAMLSAAMEAERDSIAFYNRLKAHADGEGQAILSDIIREEERHLGGLEAKKQLTKEDTP